jgi:hypothetical protein
MTSEQKPRQTDPEWEVARSVLVGPSDAVWAAADADVLAIRHPMGWFIRAQYRRGLAEDQLRDVAEFVLVRTYLLLTHGPQPDLWEEEQSAGEALWHTTLLLPQEVVGVGLPDTLPFDW